MPRIFVPFTLSFLVVLCSLSQTTRRMPQDYASIQAAISAAVNGDTVLVAEGSYFVNLRINKKIVLGSLYLVDGDSSHISKTILNGSTPQVPNDASVIILESGADVSTLISGFTITGGTGTLIYDPTDGTTWRCGGGILCLTGGATIARNIIRGNTLNSTQSSGGGFCIWYTAAPFIFRENIVRENVARATTFAEGGGLSIGITGSIVNNLVVRNQTYHGQAGGIVVWNSGFLELINNTIAYNTSFEGPEGVRVQTGWPVAESSIHMLNNILWNPGDGVELAVANDRLHAAHNLIRESFYGDVILNVDPLFADTITYALSASSPCISNGVMNSTSTGASLTAPVKDLLGNPRPDGTGTAPDLGACESPFSAAQPFTQAPQMFHLRMMVDGIERRYVVFLPHDYATRSALPLVLLYHGDSGSSESVMRLGFNTIADREGFIAVYPNSTTNVAPAWLYTSSEAIDIRFTRTLLDSLRIRYRVDPTRVFVSGHSRGASICYWLAAFLGERIAAIGPISNTIDTKLPGPTTFIPMISFMGTADKNVSYYGSTGRYSAEAGVAYWARMLDCVDQPVQVALPNVDPADGSTVTRISYARTMTSSPPVQFYRINNGSHYTAGPQEIPAQAINHDINAPELIWSFFRDLPRAVVALDRPGWTVDLCGVPVNASDTFYVRLRNVGSTDLTITSASTTQPVFGVSGASGLPALLHPGDQGAIPIVFQPTDTVQYADSIVVQLNDTLPRALTLALRGRGIRAIESMGFGVIYAATNVQSQVSLQTIDAATMSVMHAYPMNAPKIQSLSAHPSSGELFGIYSLQRGSQVVRIGAASGSVGGGPFVDIANIRALACGYGDTLFVATGYGEIYRIDDRKGSAVLLSGGSGRTYSGLVFDCRATHEGLWATALFPNDSIFSVDMRTGAIRQSSRLPFSSPLIALTPGTPQELYALFDNGMGQYYLGGIDVETFAGRLVQQTPIAVAGITAMAQLIICDVASVEWNPMSYSLSQNYPNPFNPTTNFGFRIADFGFVRVSVYDLLGREVAVLVNEEKPPGTYTVTWDARLHSSNSGGQASGMASGIYFYTLTAGTFRETKRMMLIK